MILDTSEATDGEPLLIALSSAQVNQIVRSRRPRLTPSARAEKDGEQIADALLSRHRIGKREIGVNFIGVAATDALTRDVASYGELRDDPVRRAFGDADALADVA